MPSLLLRGLRATSVSSRSPQSSESVRKHTPDRPLSDRSSPHTQPSSLTSSTPAAKDTARSVPTVVDSASSHSGHPESSSAVAAFKRRLAHRVSVSSFKGRLKKKVVEVPTKTAELWGSEKVPSAANQPNGGGTLLPDNCAPVRTLNNQAADHTSTLSSSEFEPLHLNIQRKQRQRQSLRGYLRKSSSPNHTFVKMATDNAQPPVSYSRLQDITTSVS